MAWTAGHFSGPGCTCFLIEAFIALRLKRTTFLARSAYGNPTPHGPDPGCSMNPLAPCPVPGRYGWCPRGVPASFIVPQGILFEELDLRKEPMPFTPKPPATATPIGIPAA
jgi:hypothetical protein